MLTIYCCLKFAHNPFSHHAMIHLYNAAAARNRHRAAGPALAERTAILAANGYEDGARNDARLPSAKPLLPEEREESLEFPVASAAVSKHAKRGQRKDFTNAGAHTINAPMNFRISG
jgi:hypothetical protein